MKEKQNNRMLDESQFKCFENAIKMAQEKGVLTTPELMQTMIREYKGKTVQTPINTILLNLLFLEPDEIRELIKRIVNMLYRLITENLKAEHENSIGSIGPASFNETQEKFSWISVEDNLPEIVTKDGESDYVLVRYCDCIPMVAKYCTEEYHVCPTFRKNGKKYRSHWIRPDGTWVMQEITHYMNIPGFSEKFLERMNLNG